MPIDLLFLSLISGIVISFLVTPIAIVLVKKLRLIDDPRTHKHPAILHSKPIPRGGGLPIYLSILIGAILIFSPVDKIITGILLIGLVVVIVGLLDDKYDLSPYFRFSVNILCAVAVLSLGIPTPYITNPLGGILHFSPEYNNFLKPFSFIPFSNIITVIWIVWVMNMLNWSKGVDGQMPGIASISLIVIGIATLRFPVIESQNILYSQFAFLVAGVSLGYLPFNYTGRMLPGYSSTILGFLIGILSILSGVKLATAMLVMGVPMTDAVITILRRIISGRSPFWHDKEHLHHLLLDINIPRKLIAPLYWLFSAVLGFIALNLSSRGKLFAIILVIILVSGVILFLRFLRKIEIYD